MNSWIGFDFSNLNIDPGTSKISIVTYHNGKIIGVAEYSESEITALMNKVMVRLERLAVDREKFFSIGRTDTEMSSVLDNYFGTKGTKTLNKDSVLAELKDAGVTLTQDMVTHIERRVKEINTARDMIFYEEPITSKDWRDG